MSSKRNIKFYWYDPVLFNICIPLIGFLIKLLFFTCRFKIVHGKEKAEQALAKSGERAVWASWHQRAALHGKMLPSKQINTLVSQSRDGEIAARLLYSLGFSSVRGSSTRGGSEALKNLVKNLKKGISAGLVVDGPNGPARKPKIGAVIIAKMAQVPLIPVSWGADRCWIMNSWDRLMIPKPFAKISYRFDDPIYIPKNIESKELEKIKDSFEEKLNRCTTWCDLQMGEERPWRKSQDKDVPLIGPLHDKN